MGCGGHRDGRSCARPQWPELCLPGLSCLRFSPPERVWVPRPPQAASPGPIWDTRPRPWPATFPEESTAPQEAPHCPVTALKVGARRPSRNGMEGKQLRTQFGLVRRLAGYKGTL